MSSVAIRISRRADVERIGAAVEHPAHPVERRVGIASRAPPCAARRSGRRTPRRPCRSGAGCARSSPRRTRGRRLGAAPSAAAIASCSTRLMSRRPSPSAYAISASRAGASTRDAAARRAASARSSSCAELVRRQRLQHVDRRARQQRAVHLERRILGRRADERDEPLLDVRQERVLLRLVEAMDLVDEQDRRAGRDCASVASARATASRMSLTPESTADSAMNSALNASAISRASVVLPTPGGPHRIIECGLPDANATASGLPGASRCRWPTTSSMVAGAGARRAALRDWRWRRDRSRCVDPSEHGSVELRIIRHFWSAGRRMDRSTIRAGCFALLCGGHARGRRLWRPLRRLGLPPRTSSSSAGANTRVSPRSGWR